MGTISVKDAAGSNQTAALVASTGSTTDANSLPVTHSTEDKAVFGAVAETAPASDTASSGLNGRLQRVAQRITSLIALLPASLGAKAAASSLAVTQSTEDAAQLGALTETAPATDTASSGLNGRLQRIAQRLTTIVAGVGTHDGVAGTDGFQNLGYASDTAPSAVSGAADYVRQWLSLAGAQFGIPIAHVTGGFTAFKLVSAASTNATSLKGSAGKLAMLVLTNKNAATRSFKLYNKASSPTVGTDVPVFTFEVPGNTAGAGMVVPIPPQGISFSTGIAYATTVENTDVGSTGVALGDVVVNGAYI